MEEWAVPSRQCNDSDEGIEEERRLCYVGITRAKDRLVITSAELRRSWGTTQFKEASRFISELPPALCQFQHYSSSYNNWDMPKTNNNNYRANNSQTATALHNNDSHYTVNQRVKHPSFG
jgi:DNA helicase-2/ATP-dependent DNA helicase PcrA